MSASWAVPRRRGRDGIDRPSWRAAECSLAKTRAMCSACAAARTTCSGIDGRVRSWRACRPARRQTQAGCRAGFPGLCTGRIRRKSFASCRFISATKSNIALRMSRLELANARTSWASHRVKCSDVASLRMRMRSRFGLPGERDRFGKVRILRAFPLFASSFLRRDLTPLAMPSRVLARALH